MTTYREERFHPDLLPPTYSANVSRTIGLGVQLGWLAYLSKNGDVRLEAPDNGETPGAKVFFHPRKKEGHHRIKQIQREIVKGGDPMRLAFAQGTFGAENISNDTAYDSLDKMRDGLTVKVEEDAPLVEVAAVQPNERRLVKQGPMLAKATEGRGYKSDTTIEREWSDGTTDYKCARCDFNSTDRLAVRSHWQVHVKEDESARVERSKVFPAEVPNAVLYAPRQARVAALAAALGDYFGSYDLSDAGSPVSVEEVSRQALTWVHEQSRKGSILSAEAEDMSDSEVLARIRTLLDKGEQAHRVEDLQRRLDDAEARLEQVQEAQRQAEEKARKAEDTLHTFKELLRDA